MGLSAKVLTSRMLRAMLLRMTKQKRATSGLGRFGDPGALILLSVSSAPRHGHAMIADIDTQFGIRLGPGTLYGSISKLAERGLLKALPPDNRRRPYAITPAGRQALEEYIESWSTVVEVGTRRLATS